MLRFNPLPHAEGDRRSHRGAGREGVSIHSLTQRETRNNKKPLKKWCVSIHSLTQRETPICCAIVIRSAVSIHSLTQRETNTGGIYLQ